MEKQTPQRAVEPEHNGPIWTHPYLIYVALTAILFLFLLVMAYFAWTRGWIPNRGITS